MKKEYKMNIQEKFSKTLTFFKIKNKNESEIHEISEKQDTKQINFPFDQLPQDLKNHVVSLCSLEDLSRFANTDVKNSENNLIWQLAAANLNISLCDKSPLSPKLQIKENFIKKFHLGTLNIIKKKVIISHYNSKKFNEDSLTIFDKYVPQGFFFKDYIGYGCHKITYRNEQGLVKEIISVGTIKQQWQPGEQLEWVSVHNSKIELTVLKS